MGVNKQLLKDRLAPNESKMWVKTAAERESGAQRKQNVSWKKKKKKGEKIWVNITFER